MNALVMIFVIFFGALAPGQTISEMKMLEGGVMALQDGVHLYLSSPAGVDVKIGDIELKSGDGPHWGEKLSNGIEKFPLKNFGLVGAGEIVVGIRQPSGEFINQKVENIAGKVTLLPGDVTLIEGQQLRIATLIFGAPSEVRLIAGFKQLKLGIEKKKSTLATGAVATEYLEGYELPVGDWKVTFSGRNGRGVFSDTIRVRVLKTLPLVACSTRDCDNILK